MTNFTVYDDFFKKHKFKVKHDNIMDMLNKHKDASITRIHIDIWMKPLYPFIDPEIFTITFENNTQDFMQEIDNDDLEHFINRIHFIISVITGDKKGNPEKYNQTEAIIESLLVEARLLAESIYQEILKDIPANFEDRNGEKNE